jgi:hypothetical protein
MSVRTQDFFSEGDIETEAQRAYESAVERLAYAVRTWEEAGSPLTSVGSQGQEIVHPLWRVVNEAEVMADKLRSRLVKRPMGRPKVAKLQRSIGSAPAQKLRVAK